MGVYIMKTMKKYTFEEWKEKFKNRATVSCGIHYEDGWTCTACFERYMNVVHDIEFFMKEHGNVAYIVSTK